MHDDAPSPVTLEDPPSRDASAEPRPLPPHRIALRLICQGGLAGALAGCTLVTPFLLSDGFPGAGDVLVAYGLAVLAAGVLCGLLTLGEELAWRVPREGRPLLLAALGCAVAPMIAVVGIWTLTTVVEGGGPEQALAALAQLLEEIRRFPRRYAFVAAAILLPFTALGSLRVRALPGLRRDPPLGWQVAIAALGGCLSLAWSYAELGQPSQRELPLVLGVFVFGPAVSPLGLVLGRRLEARLLRLRGAQR